MISSRFHSSCEIRKWFPNKPSGLTTLSRLTTYPPTFPWIYLGSFTRPRYNFYLFSTRVPTFCMLKLQTNRVQFFELFVVWSVEVVEFISKTCRCVFSFKFQVFDSFELHSIKCFAFLLFNFCSWFSEKLSNASKKSRAWKSK